MTEMDIEGEIWKMVLDLNRTWARDGNAEGLRDYFHEDMVAITPTERERIEGREACINAWKAFIDRADVRQWKEIDPNVLVYDGRFAVVTYYYDMSVDLDGERLQLSGRDMFVLLREDDRWWVIANQFSPDPSSQTNVT